MTAAWRAIAAALVFLWTATAAAAEERILNFDSAIAVQKDAALDVNETIRVNAENNQINHGIYRDFPTRYTIPNGGKMKVGFTFLDATLDGQPVDHAQESRGNGVRIKLGSADSLVSPGEHVYRLHYKVDRELGFFKDYNELYWNVTGNGWVFPIDRASATITLPSPAKFGQRSAYTGAQGSTAKDAQVVEESDGSIRFETTAPLGAYEGLTVATAFPKGVVDEPRANQKMGWFIADLLPMIVAVLGLLGTIGFLYYVWKRVGRDPRAGTVIPLFSPPDDMSPSAMRYVMKQGFDDRAFAAAIVDAGVKGHVRLSEDKGFLFFGGDKFIEGVVPSATSVPLESAEQTAITALVAPGEKIELDNKNHATFSTAKSALEEAYKTRFDEHAFKRNYGWAGVSILVWLGAAYLTALAIVLSEGLAPGYMQMVPFLALGAAWLHFLPKTKRTTAVSCVLALVGLALVAVAGITAITTIGLALGSGRWQAILVILVGLPLAISSFFWISAPTPEGRALLDKIAGFKQYLSITERERLDRMQAPADTLQTFERFLPYAIALEIENRWADRFSSQLAAAAAAANAGIQQGFLWYSGSHSPWADATGFTNSIGSSLSSSISSASTAPGSSSGSGGGGSSGGGGGGGGGGGW
ncbi:MAG: DUF2207 domain-containing protein [Sphingomonas sp.]|nr:DUF2207 domain-containing protein [Sphingomonas sp.]